MIKQTKKVISIILVLMLIVTCISALIVTADAATQKAENSLADSQTFKVNATSNLSESVSETYSENDGTVNIKMYFKSSEAIANGEFEIKYDPSKLSFSRSNYNDLGIIKITPAVSEVGGVIVNEEPVGTIIGSFTSPIDFYNFSEEKVMFNVTFDIIGTGETTVDFNMLEMDAITPGTGNKKMMVLKGQTLDLFTQSAKATLAISKPATEPVNRNLTVTSSSNIAESFSYTYSENDTTANIKLYFKSDEAIANGEFEIKYDPTKLSFSSSNYDNSGIIKITPAVSEVGGVVINEKPVGTIIGSFSSPIDFYDFSEEKVMFDITFDIIGTGETEVNFNMLEMDAITPGTGNKKMMVLNGQTLDLFTQSAKASFKSAKDQPTTKELTVVSSSNIAESFSNTYSENDTTANIKLYFQSSEAIANGEFEIKYDPTKLSFSSSNYDNSGIIKITPAISEVGGVVINEKPVGTIIGSFSSPIDFYDFSEEKVMFDITFDIIGTGETEVNFNMLEMDAITPGTGNKKMMVLNGQALDLFNQSAKASFTSAKDQPTTKKLTVVSSSNIAESFSYTYSENDTTANIKLYFQSSEAIANGEFEIKYDPTKLSFNSSNYDNSGIIKITPVISEVGGVVVNEKPVGTIIGSFSSPIDFYDFSEEKVMFDISFDIIGTGETEVNFNMLEMDAITPGTGNKKMMVLNGQALDLFTQSAKASFTPSEKPIPEVFIGDADGDNAITVKDATSIQMYCATFQELTEQQLLNADADRDNLVTIKDATHIQMYCAGFITEL